MTLNQLWIQSTLIAALLLVLVCPASSQGLDGLDVAAAEARLDSLMADFDETTPGAVVAVMQDGEVIFERGYGMANLTYEVPFTPETATNIGSVSKQFTGFALALLAERGELSLDDDVRDYIPELPDFGETVTLRHLLTHTTGYREYLNTLALAGRRILDSDHVERVEALKIVQRQPELQNAPGAEFNYNNTGYALAAMVVERVSGRSFPEWMEEEVFRPLGMYHTLVRAHVGQVVPGSAVGYSGDAEEGFLEARDLGASMGPGGIYTTVADVARWMDSLATGTLGGEAVIRAMTTPYVLADGDTTGYGLGLNVGERRGLKAWSHGGADTAHRARFVFYPELNAGYVVLSNYASFEASIYREVEEAFFGHLMEETDESESAAPEAVAVDPELLAAYAGRYELEEMPGNVVTVSLEGDLLSVRLPGQAALETVATTDSTFLIEEYDITVTFHGDGSGDVEKITVGSDAARRVPDTGEIELAAYAGRYFSEELETFYTLEVEEDELILRVPRYEPVTLEHAQEDVFSGSFPIGSITFERDEEGRVTGFRAQNGRTRDVLFERVD